jgi:TRAP-type C4-dicarboxylate transport system permease large subunit
MMQITWFGLGCFVDSTNIIFITSSVFTLVANFLGFDPLWLVILYTVNTETGYLTPPFVILQVIGLLIVILLPPVATWLPNMMIKVCIHLKVSLREIAT